MAYADVSDLEARWRTLTDDEQARAAVLLDDASAMLAALVTVDDTDEQQAALLKIVTCNMVQRAMSVASDDGVDLYGVTQQSMTAVGFTRQLSYANPTGDLYITKAEKKMLRIGGKIGVARPSYGILDGDCDESD
jgi:hypothetical protein